MYNSIYILLQTYENKTKEIVKVKRVLDTDNNIIKGKSFKIVTKNYILYVHPLTIVYKQIFKYVIEINQWQKQPSAITRWPVDAALKTGNFPIKGK